MAKSTKTSLKRKVVGIKAKNEAILALRKQYPATVKAFENALLLIKRQEAHEPQVDSLLRRYDELRKDKLSHAEAFEIAIWLWSEGSYTNSAAINAAINTALK
jgi:P2-related tail formation protein